MFEQIAYGSKRYHMHDLFLEFLMNFSFRNSIDFFIFYFNNLQ